MPAEGTYLLIARVATTYYFVHFLVILPILGKKEKTLPIPLSIMDPILGGSSKPDFVKKKQIFKLIQFYRFKNRIAISNCR